MPDFSADLNRLVFSADAWGYGSNNLHEGVVEAEEIEFSNKEVVWAVFQDSWDANLKAVRYTKERLKEGAIELQAMSDALNHVVKVLMEQDENFARVLIKSSVADL
ncbi:hypothetical protein [Nocardia lasii]|uniref:Uncharacterized protein n=1 Tax=Nocardia lasii TaxID=1616107 RepID=A0ABW1JWY9_9NOCA